MDYYGPMKPVHRLIATLLLPLGATAQVANAGSDAGAPPPSSALDAPLFYQLLLGELEFKRGEAGTGFSLLLDAARKTNDANLYRRAIDIAIQSRAGDAALQAARAWKQAQPGSHEAGRMLLQIMVALNRLDDVAELLATEIGALPPHQRNQAILGIPRAFERMADKQRAAHIVEQALRTQRADPRTAMAAWIATGRVHLKAENSQEALEAARQAQEIDPASEDAALLAVALMGPTQPLAEALVRRYLGTGSPKPEVRLAYGRALLNASRRADALAQFQQVTHERPDEAPAWLAVGLLKMDLGQSDAAQAALERYLDLTANTEEEALQRGATQAFVALAQLAQRRGDLAGAQRWVDRIGGAEDNFGIVSLRASLLARQGQFNAALEMIRNWPERTSADARAKLLGEVQLLRDHKRTREAFELLDQATGRWPEDADLIYEKAMLAEKLGRFDVMERLLREIIADHPNYHHAFNALGYSLADRNTRIDEARQLIEAALRFAPEDPMIKDSLGWVEFRSGNLDQALQILQGAYQALPDADIAAHLGEVLWQLKQRERALAIWREGLLLNPESEALTQTLKRLQVQP